MQTYLWTANGLPDMFGCWWHRAGKRFKFWMAKGRVIIEKQGRPFTAATYHNIGARNLFDGPNPYIRVRIMMYWRNAAVQLDAPRCQIFIPAFANMYLPDRWALPGTDIRTCQIPTLSPSLLTHTSGLSCIRSTLGCTAKAMDRTPKYPVPLPIRASAAQL